MNPVENQEQSNELLEQLRPILARYAHQPIATTCCFLLCRIAVPLMSLDEAIVKFKGVWREVQKEQGIQ